MNNQSRNPDRINKTLKLIEKIWKENPDLRLCQLISNCFFIEDDLYYVEDDILYKELTDTYKEVK